jgi:hypothetical protein
LLADSVSAMVPVPVFLTYMVWFVLVPACIVPQDMVDLAAVQVLSEYTPMFGVVVMVPDVFMSWLTVITASVVADSDSAITIRATTANFDVFAIAIRFSHCLSTCILRLNKHY